MKFATANSQNTEIMKPFLNFLIIAGVSASFLSCGSSQSQTCVSDAGEILASSSTAVVSTDKGKVAGYILDGVTVYKGIPYARAERFMPAEPVEKWKVSEAAASGDRYLHSPIVRDGSMTRLLLRLIGMTVSAMRIVSD